jgi:hypothetical protein
MQRRRVIRLPREELAADRLCLRPATCLVVAGCGFDSLLIHVLHTDPIAAASGPSPAGEAAMPH